MQHPVHQFGRAKAIDRRVIQHVPEIVSRQAKVAGAEMTDTDVPVLPVLPVARHGKGDVPSLIGQPIAQKLELAETAAMQEQGLGGGAFRGHRRNGRRVAVRGQGGHVADPS